MRKELPVGASLAPLGSQSRLQLACPSFGIAALTVVLAVACALAPQCSLAAPQRDSRNFGNGCLIPVESYCDQPRIVVTSNGAWVCVLTTGPGEEGARGQHVVSTTSLDKGRTWSKLVDVEPADPEKASAYALVLLTPADRVYAFYCYNGDGIRTKPDGKPIRDDMQGWLCYRYSDDQARSWSKRYRIPMRLTAVDRGNEWQGKLQMFWAIGTPAVFDGKAIFGFAKLGKYILEQGEGWFCRSDNVLTEPDPEKIQWEMLPDGEHGVRAPEFGSVQEEFDVVPLQGSDLFCVYRTTLGHAACAYSRDGGHTWSKPDVLRYEPGGRPIKQPRACAKIWKTRDGQYLLWFHNNSTRTYNNGPNAGSRNIAWLSAGRLVNGMLHWSQPEVVAYVDGGVEGCSYPDLVEDGGQYCICATQKTQARVMEVDPGLLAALWGQHTLRALVTNGLVLNLSEKQCVNPTAVAAPRLPQLGGEVERGKPRDTFTGGFSIDVTVRFADLGPGQVLLDSRDAAGRGYVLRTSERDTLRLEFSDGWQAAFWQTDAGLLKTNTTHDITAIVDGRANLVCFVVDGVLCDGGSERQFGFGRFSPNFKSVSGGRLRIAPSLRGDLGHVRIYNRALLISEAVSNRRAGGIQ